MLDKAKDKIYDNCAILAPDGQLLGYCQKKRLNWYVSRGLAKLLDENSMQLFIEPKGRSGVNDPHHCSTTDNICVICASEVDLTRHHVVPHCFTKHMPNPYRLHNCHDIVALCVSCHLKYEGYSYLKKQELAARYGVPIAIDFRHPEKLNQLKLQGWAKAILYYPVPENRVIELKQRIAKLLGRYPTQQDLEEIMELTPHKLKNSVKTFGQMIIEKIDDYDEFAIEWRKHFVETMQPKYLKGTWNIDKKLSK